MVFSHPTSSMGNHGASCGELLHVCLSHNIPPISSKSFPRKAPFHIPTFRPAVFRSAKKHVGSEAGKKHAFLNSDYKFWGPFFKKKKSIHGRHNLLFFRQQDKPVCEVEYHVRKARRHNKVDWNTYRFKSVIFRSCGIELPLQPAAPKPMPKSPASQIHAAINRRASNKSKQTKLLYVLGVQSQLHYEWGFSLSYSPSWIWFQMAGLF